MLNASKTGRLKPETLLCYHQIIKQCQSHLPKERPCSLTAYTLLDSHIHINIIITNRSPGMFCRNIFPC